MNLTQRIPAPLIRFLQRSKLTLTLRKTYVRAPFDLAQVPRPDFISTYARLAERNSASYKNIMQKLDSYVGSGPVGPNKRWEYPWIIQNLDLKPGLSILDAGCGRAPLQYFYADMGLKVSAIDPFENVGWHGIDRRLAKKYGLAIDYRVEGMEKISYASATFDRVVSVSVLEHCRAVPVADELHTAQTQADCDLQARMMREMARVLKPNGILALTLDFIYPRRSALLECNIDVKNVIEASGLSLMPLERANTLYGYDSFSLAALESTPGLAIQDYKGVASSSIGLVFRKGA
ncbi:MAG: hypothetical protein A2487_07775 [Candidatus Raymondbacteria bacterium RifOxyC12_full_50_8]|nr:MAG: hypothetical protein A2248_13185 [Candidatus Raymondbacteria bacterium RIFOXYA2_FULL_49_16]OGJ96052.1 MAG: hypothetical protein A2350_04625 [Candidatus Raymondbacteria bacterium RifOxyB12_full_50_8]OGJ99322.1 MAG: hypothetical protein A2487_07775 [Candidatus Raymondbacteria bacterium RifOxyC12_full_50_8]OGP45147.1 MAG: hypothetical protein A2324_12170 [Candidatus Raymondbacteria bacterium RIFOXYB2_FULL_49_35]